MAIRLHTDLQTNGWVEIENISSDKDLLKLSNELGQIIPQHGGQLIYKLSPSNGKNSVRGSFSNIHGFGSFPLHTDTAFWSVPVRYILLSSIYPSSCNTILTNSHLMLNQFESKDRENAKRAIFKVRTSHSQFYSTLIFNEKKDTGIKYDPACMFPVNKYAIAFVQKIKEIEMPIVEIKWKGTNSLVIDNWKIFHGRNAAFIDEKRELKRIYIN